MKKGEGFAEISKRLEDIGGYRGLQYSFSDRGFQYNLAEQYAAMTRIKAISNPVQLASFDQQRLIHALENIADPEKKKQFLLDHQRALDSLLDGGLDVKPVKTDYSLDIRRICSNKLADHINKWVEAIETKDRVLQIESEKIGDSLLGHSYKVAQFAVVIGEYCGLNEEEVNYVLPIAGILHDIGKTGIGINILGKPGKLSEDERKIMNLHVCYSEDFIACMERDAKEPDDRLFLGRIKEPIGAHHEWYNGKGYAKGLTGKDTSKIARILSFADAYEAMNANRVYRPALDSEVVRHEILVKGKGKQFDPELCEERLFERLEEARKAA